VSKNGKAATYAPTGEEIVAALDAPPTKLDLACGQHKQEGFFGVDIANVEGVDLVYNLTTYPWPFADNTVEEVFCSHYVEHTYPVGTAQDGLIAFMNEVWRICTPDAMVKIIHPYLKSIRAFQDPTHTRFIPEATWHYFSQDWLISQGLDHYPITANFEVTNIASGVAAPWNLRSQEAQQFAADHYWNVVTDLIVSLRAIKA
jgi:predicted SAM-dependent methyltransferase